MEAKSDIDSVDLFLEIENKDMLEMSWTTGFKLVNRCTSPKKSDSRHERERDTLIRLSCLLLTEFGLMGMFLLTFLTGLPLC